ncbi:hypothetical protein DFH27DRAFT_706 [Peziza echinospora]|nr:hypothetical protein DFH27DRAFT_706 [Peziza echinospora]
MPSSGKWSLRFNMPYRYYSIITPRSPAQSAGQISRSVPPGAIQGHGHDPKDAIPVDRLNQMEEEARRAEGRRTRAEEGPQARPPRPHGVQHAIGPRGRMGFSMRSARAAAWGSACDRPARPHGVQHAIGPRGRMGFSLRSARAASRVEAAAFFGEKKCHDQVLQAPFRAMAMILTTPSTTPSPSSQVVPRRPLPSCHPN